MALPPFPLEPLLGEVRARSTGIGSEVHGELHWRTVGANGFWLADSLDGAETYLIFLFALLHDAMRENDWDDPGHGPRAAALAGELYSAGLIPLEQTKFELLQYACAEHADGKISTDPTVGACWDADRLDLPRVGVTPNPDLFSTDLARSGTHIGSDPPGWLDLYSRL